MGLFGRPSEEDEQRAAAYGEWLRRRHPYAIASMVLGVFSLIEFGVLVIFGVAGIVLGVMALRELRSEKSSGAQPYTAGRRLAWGGIVLSAVSLVIAAGLYLRVFG